MKEKSVLILKNKYINEFHDLYNKHESISKQIFTCNTDTDPKQRRTDMQTTDAITMMHTHVRTTANRPR